MTTILVADPRPVNQEQIERAVEDSGYATSGQPAIVLTPDTRTAQLWSSRNIPVVLYDYEDHVDIVGLMVTVLALLDRD